MVLLCSNQQGATMRFTRSTVCQQQEALSTSLTRRLQNLDTSQILSRDSSIQTLPSPSTLCLQPRLAQHAQQGQVRKLLVSGRAQIFTCYRWMVNVLLPTHSFSSVDILSKAISGELGYVFNQGPSVLYCMHQDICCRAALNYSAMLVDYKVIQQPAGLLE